MKQKVGNLAIVGADVWSLFPSLKSVESARLAIKAIPSSKVEFENIDCHRDLQYLFIVGGQKLLNKAGLGRLSPKWKGDRVDLVTVGGKILAKRRNR